MQKDLLPEVYVAIYLRLSRDDQNGNAESMSIINQREMLLSYCEERGWKVYDIYVDDGFSGTTFERPGFGRMIEDIKSRHINVVLTKDLSRLGRNYVMTGQYTDFFFPENGVRYVAINDSYDSANEDNDIAPFKNILNEMYAKDISKKIRSARQTSARQGKFMGSKPPFGYIKSIENKHLLVIDPPAAKIVKRIFSEYAEGQSGRNIAAKLNAENIETPAVYYFRLTGKRSTKNNCSVWGSATIMQLLKNQVYIGDMVGCKRRVASFKTKKRLVSNPDEWAIVCGTHEPLIDRHTWDSVVRRIEMTKGAKNNSAIRKNSTEEVNLFSGIIRCADCGAAMAFNRKIRKSGAEKWIYRCSRYANNGANACSMHTIDAKLLENVILSDIQSHAKKVLGDEEKLLGKLMDFSESELQHEKTLQQKSLLDMKNRMAFVENASKMLFEEKIIGNVPDILFKKMLTDYEHELLELKQKSSDTKQHLERKQDSEQGARRWVDLIKDCASIKSLDRATAFRLIDYVSIGERTNESGEMNQSIHVKYNFVGVLS